MDGMCRARRASASTIGKRIGAWLLLAVLCFGLWGCGAREADFPFEALLPVTDTESEAVDSENLVERGYYRIIIPADSSADFLEAARAFAERVEDATDRYVYVRYDSDPVTEGNAADIVLGNADRLVAQMMLGELRDGEYLCRMQDGVIVLGGRDEDATLAAMERFCAEWLPYASEEQLMRPDGGFSYYLAEPQAVRLNGYLLSDYCIVVPDDASDAVRRLSAGLRERLADIGEVSLPVVSSSEYAGGKRAITLAVDAEHAERGTVRFIPEETGLALQAADAFGLSVAVRTLCEELAAGAYALTAVRTVSYEDPQVRIASVMLDHLLPIDTPTKVMAIASPVTAHGAELVLVGELSTEAALSLGDNLSGYERLDIGGSGGTAVPAYAKSGCAERIVRLSESRMGSLSVTEYRVGEGEAAFVLVGISGEATAAEALVLPSALAERGLPVMIVLHIKQSAGAMTVSVQGHELDCCLAQTYTVRTNTYTLTCYGTAGAFSVMAGNADDGGGYRDMTIERVSVKW